MTEEKKVELPIKEEAKDEVYHIPEIGSEGSLTGRTIVYKRGELGERWRLMKKAAETDQERLDIADTELRSLKREQVFFNKDKGAFTDDFGNIYHGKEVNDKNNLVRAKAVVILNENKIKTPNYVNKFMWSKSRDWKEEPIDETKIDWATGLTPDENERQEYKKQKAKNALAQIKKTEAIKKTEVKSDDEIYPLSRSEEIKRYIEALPQPSVEQIIKNRAAIRTRYSGIGSLNFKESEFQIEQPKSTGLNYLKGLDDDEIT
jgi:glycerol-3-phosphate cytidylyltransferase-like family protein